MNQVSLNDALSASISYFNGDELAADSFVHKYALQNNNDELLEKTPTDMHWRMAKEFARIEKKKFKNPLTEQEIFDCFDNFKWIVPQGSPMYGIGNNFQTVSLSNCFLCDTPEDSYGSIMRVDEQAVQLCKRRGGTGVDLSKLRPAGALTHNAARTSTGLVSWMQRYARSIGEVGQNGRRGALIELLSIHHPQIMDFISIKDKEFDAEGNELPPKIEGANLSIKLSDEFLTAVKEDKDYELRWPVDSKTPTISQKVSARQIWNEIIRHAHGSGEPGLLFWDNILRETPSSVYEDYRPQGTNPSLRENTLVLTENGIFPIKYLAEKQPICKVKNAHNEWKECRVFKSGENKQLVKITFTNHQTVFCTKEHKWPILNSQNRLFNLYTNKVLKKEAISLKRKDRIYLPFSETPWNNKNCSFTKDDGFVLGWNMGDGWITEKNNDLQYGFVFSFEDVQSQIAQRVIDYTNQLAKKPSTLRDDHDSKCKTFVTTDKNIQAKMQALGATKKSNGISQELWRGNQQFIKGFIDGIYSSDGCIELKKSLSGSRITLTTAHLKIAEDLQKLLIFYGIKSYIQYQQNLSCFPNSKYNSDTKYYPRYDLRIHGLEMYKFAKIFTLTNIKKQEKLNQILEMYQTKQYSSKVRDNQRNYLTIKTVELTDIYEDVYDITVNDDTHTFLMESGLTGNCAELILSPLDSCRLLLLNLYSFVKNPFTKDAKFDFENFAKYARIAQRLMDDLVDLEAEKIFKILKKIESDPEDSYTKARELDMWIRVLKYCTEGRRTGTGTTGFGDAMAALGIPYASEKCFEEADKIFRTLKLSCYRESVEMAKELGPFKCYDAKKEENSPFIQRIKAEDEKLYQDMVKYGRRNIALLTISPAGTVSILTQTTSGIEPLFEMTYKRRRKLDPSVPTSKVSEIDANGNRWQVYSVIHPKITEWMRITGETDIQKSPWAGSCTNEISWVNRVKLQALIQTHICHSISSTVNIGKSTSCDEVAKIYETAWHSGCKGLTVYRDGCRDGVLIKNNTTQPLKKHITKTQAPKRPKELPCDIFHIKITKKLDKIRVFDYMVLVGLLNGHEPYEVFAVENGKYDKKITKGRIIRENQGIYHLIMDDNVEIKNITRDTTENEDALTRLTSTSLRHGVDIQYIVQQLSKVEGSDLYAFSKSIARALKHYIKEGTTGSTCSQCGAKLIFENGCFICKGCGNSKC